MSLPLSPLARRLLPLIDLTELSPTSQSTHIEALCRQALALPVPVAALCVRPEFVSLAKTGLAGSRIRSATVINFPTAAVTLEQCSHNTDASTQVRATKAAIAAGADEIDVVFAYGAFQAGRGNEARACLEAVKAGCGDAVLKVILESSAFADMASLRAAAELAVEAGADFLKTSSGMHSGGATPEAVRALCEVSRAYAKHIGIKISGGVRTAQQAQDYLDLVAGILGLNWIEPTHFRFGASKLVEALVSPQPVAAGGY